MVPLALWLAGGILPDKTNQIMKTIIFLEHVPGWTQLPGERAEISDTNALHLVREGLAKFDTDLTETPEQPKVKKQRHVEIENRAD